MFVYECINNGDIENITYDDIDDAAFEAAMNSDDDKLFDYWVFEQ